MTDRNVLGKVKTRNDTASNWSLENPVLLPGEMGLETDTGNGKFGDGITTWNSLPYAFQRNSTKNVEYIKGTQKSSTGSFTGVTEDNSLYDGKCINYYLPFDGNGNATLNLTFPDNTSSGAKPIYLFGSKRLSTQFSSGQIFSMCYSSTEDAWFCGNFLEDINSLIGTGSTAGTISVNNIDVPVSGLSTIATSGSYNDLSDKPTNFVTTDTAQNITGAKTFVGTKLVNFKQSANNDKLGFTLFSSSNVERGYLEFNPTNTVDGVAGLMTLGNYATSAAGLTQVGFRRYSNISGASGAYNLLMPLIADARVPFSLTTTYTNFYLTLGVTDGTTIVKTDKRGLLNISSLLPTGGSNITIDTTITENGTNPVTSGSIYDALLLKSDKSNTYDKTQVYTKTEVDTQISTAVGNLVNSAPSTLDTLKELSDALGSDPNFATTVTTNIGKKLDADSSNYIKNISVSGQTLTIVKGDDTSTTLTTQDTDTTYSVGTESVAGLTKLYSGVGVNTDGTMTQSAIKSELDGKAGLNHGNHVPTVQTANNAVFLRNDNSWQTVTPSNIGALGATETAVNSEKLGGVVSTDYATKSYVNTAVADLVGSVPNTLDTLQELATALGEDPNFATTISTQLGGKADKSTTYTKSEVDTLVGSKQNTLTFDNTPTANSDNPVKSGGVKSALDGKQNVLTFDSTPTLNSSNPVTSGGVFTVLDSKSDKTTTYTKSEVDTALSGKQGTLTFDTVPTENSTNPVTSGGIYSALQNFTPSGGGNTYNGNIVVSGMYIDTTNLIDNLYDFPSSWISTTGNLVDYTATQDCYVCGFASSSNSNNFGMDNGTGIYINNVFVSSIQHTSSNHSGATPIYIPLKSGDNFRIYNFNGNVKLDIKVYGVKLGDTVTREGMVVDVLFSNASGVNSGTINLSGNISDYDLIDIQLYNSSIGYNNSILYSNNFINLDGGVKLSLYDNYAMTVSYDSDSSISIDHHNSNSPYITKITGIKFGRYVSGVAVDNTVTQGSDAVVTSGGVFTALQDAGGLGSSYFDITISNSDLSSSNTYSGFPYEYSITATGVDSTYTCFIDYNGTDYRYEYAVETLQNTIKVYFSEALTSNFSARIYLGKSFEGGAGLSLPINVVIVQSNNQTITVTGSVVQNYTITADGGVIPAIDSVNLNAEIAANNGYDAGTLNHTQVTAHWGDTVTFSASPATEKAVNPEEDLSSFNLVGTYSDEGINLDTLNYGVRQSALKRTAVSVSGYNTLMVEIEFQTDGILAFDPVKTFEFSCQATSHNNAAWNMTYSDIAGYQDTNQVSVRCQILETWCTNGTHGSCWNEEITVGGNTVYVTKLRWMERISDITWYEWIDGKPNSNRCFFAGGVRISLLNDVKVVNYYHRFYLGNLSS